MRDLLTVKKTIAKGRPGPRFYLSPAQYHRFVEMIAMLNDCRLLELDWQRQSICISGSSAAVAACEAELAQWLGNGPSRPAGLN